MMKPKITAILLALTAMILTRAGAQEFNQERTSRTYTKGIRFAEGTVPYRNMILVSNFGTEELNPLNTEGRGYILSINTQDPDAEAEVFIPADGNLSAPKGMAVTQNHLLIADVNKVVIYNLRQLKDKPQVIQFPEQELFVNDIVVLADLALITVTNTGHVYAMDVSDIKEGGAKQPQLMGQVPGGANGIMEYNGAIYIASYNPTGKADAQNVIYVANVASGNQDVVKLIGDLAPGQYDGIAIDDRNDNVILYFTSWGDGTEGSTPVVWAYSIKDKGEAIRQDFRIPLTGPADITIQDGYMWLPDLPSSTLYRIPLN